jgi:hypothetical protein
MKHTRTLLLTAILTAMAITAIPATASAAGWDIDVEGGTVPLKFTVASNEVKFTMALGTTLSCTKVAGSGQYLTTTEGSLEFTFNGCQRGGGEECHSKGALFGEVTSTSLAFHNIMAESTVQVFNGIPGILITGNNNHFATLECALTTAEVIGNGVIGIMTAPVCATAAWSPTATVNFASTKPGQQEYKQVETTGTVYDFTVRRPLVTETASVDLSLVVTYEKNMKTTCP